MPSPWIGRGEGEGRTRVVKPPHPGPLPRGKRGDQGEDLTEVVDTLHRLDISRRVVSLTPIGNIKG
jgi:hypothetical protein